MDTGVLSITLNVSDIKASKEFYEKLGFETISGSVEVDYLYMKKGYNTIRLNQLNVWENYEQNYLTLNPYLDDNLHTKNKFVGLSEIKNSLIKKGIGIEKSNQLQDPEVDSFFIHDPDGNKILIEEIGI